MQVTLPQNHSGSLLPNDLEASSRILSSVIEVLESNDNATDTVSILFFLFLTLKSIILAVYYFLQILENVINVFDNVLDDSNMEGWRTLQHVSTLSPSPAAVFTYVCMYIIGRVHRRW